METNTPNEEHRHGAASRPRAVRAPVAGADELRDALSDLLESAEFVLRQASGFLAHQAEERPQLLLACAAGLGFVVGGGLASRSGGALARAGGRLVLAYFLHRDRGPMA